MQDTTVGKRGPAKSFTDLFVWQRAHELVLEIYRLSEDFPKKELYGLTSHLRRAAVSVPANIAEGFGRSGLKDKQRFLAYCRGSLEECMYYFMLARDLGYTKAGKALTDIEELSKILNSSENKLKEILGGNG